MHNRSTRILVVDDSALYRQSIHNVLREIAGVSVVGSAKDGLDALNKIEQLDPDLLTLDVQMPDMDGIQVLRKIKQRRLRPKAIMVSSFTSEAAQVTTDALMEGAFDFILKPSGSDSAANRQQLRDALAERICAFRESADRRSRFRRGLQAQLPIQGHDAAKQPPGPASACRAVILGSSTGGPEALKTVLPKLPAELSVPVFVVQHMPAQYTRSLATRLNAECPLDVVEAEDEMEATAGRIIIAAGGRQMGLQAAGERLLVRLTDDPPENSVRPSVDYLVRAAIEVLDGALLAVIMTGMGRDGLAGCLQLKQAGGFVFAQSQDDCVVYGMPKVVIERQLADRALRLGKIAPAIVRHVKRSAGS